MPRPLSELAPSSARRNSPSFDQPTKKPTINTGRDSSPFQSSPFNASAGDSSPRLFWQGRNTPTNFKAENGPFSSRESGSPSPTRRSSIEKLKRASRVKNSNMFAREQKQEYDPTHSPVLERPLARQVQGNAYGGSGIKGLRSEENTRAMGHRRSDSESTLFSNPACTANKSPAARPELPSSFDRPSSRDQSSPTKSSLTSSRFNGKASFDYESGTWSEDTEKGEKHLPHGRVLHRHAKSVTFDAAPPQVNEYEMVTPDVSSIGTIGSRENSVDEDDDEDDDYDDENMYHHEYDVDQDESFDATLDDAPVVGPDDWRRTTPDGTPDAYETYMQTFTESQEDSPLPEAGPSSPQVQRVTSRNARKGSVDSEGSSRPLPPLPALQNRDRSNSASSNGLSAITERVNSARRSLPPPPAASPFSKSDIQNFTSSQMPLDERLKLMMIQDEEKPAKTEAELQRERRLRRGSPFTRKGSTQASDAEKTEASHLSMEEEEDTLADLQIGDYKLPPRISRESILRKVKGQDEYEQEDEYQFSSQPPSPGQSSERYLPLDPDVAIPSTEDGYDDDEDTGSVIIKTEPEEGEGDLYDITEMYHSESQQGNHSREEHEECGEDDQEKNNISQESHQQAPNLDEPSQQLQSNSAATDDDGPPTPRAASPLPTFEASFEDPMKPDRRVSSLPEFQGFLGKDHEFGLGMESYMTPSPPLAPAKDKEIIDPVEDERVSRETTLDYDANSEYEDSESELDQHASALPEFIEPDFLKSPRATPALHEPEEPRAPTPEQPRTPEPMSRPVTPEQKKYQPNPEYDGTGWGSDEEDDDDEPGTPDSVIRHPPPPLASAGRDSPSIPEQKATIKSSAGSNLKTRPSATPADLHAMREQRRQVSGQPPMCPPIPERHLGPPLSRDERRVESEGEAAARKASFAKRSLTIDVGNDLSLSLDQDFDRVIEAQKRGYLMRQNTKVVVASSNPDPVDDNRGYRSAGGNSPSKAIRPQSWTVEPWNGRKKSGRDSSATRRNKHLSGPVPPLPGQESNVAGLGSLTEERHSALEEVGDRGRLFVKVIGVKELDLPLPKNERTWFCLTLDNGKHCVTTAWLELSRNAPIGQEFELVVQDELEFQLTLNAKLEKPTPKRVVESPTKQTKAQKSSTFSRVFASPKKRKEMEAKMKEEEQRFQQQKEREAAAKRASSIPTVWDLLSPLAAEDGSFARSYICLKEHEKLCYGRPYVVDVACFNEWATEEVPLSSVKSKRGPPVMQARPPYKVGKLELQLLFVPKPKGSKDEDMPKSMNSCIREMAAAEASACRQHEGHLSQQGGDCPYWRRRFFKLDGVKLTAYHESTMQPRATINLSKATKLIDDRSALTQKETKGKGGSRRRSAFAEEEEGYMFVEEGFRIRFGNGEVIDFYADSTKEKEVWMKALGAAVGREGGKVGGWCDIVLRKEEAERDREMRRKVSGGSARKLGHKKSRNMAV